MKPLCVATIKQNAAIFVENEITPLIYDDFRCMLFALAAKLKRLARTMLVKFSLSRSAG